MRTLRPHANQFCFCRGRIADAEINFLELLEICFKHLLQGYAFCMSQSHELVLNFFFVVSATFEICQRSLISKLCFLCWIL